MTDASGGVRRTGRLLSVVAVAVLLVTAGCSGGNGGATPTPTGTTTDGTTEATETSTIAEGLPPGITGGGDIDGEVLLAAHEEALASGPFTHVIEANRTVEAPAGTRNSSDRQVTQFDGDSFVTTYSREGARNFRQVTWGNDSVAISRVRVGNRTQYDRRDAARLGRNLTGEQFVRQFLSMGSYSVEDVDRAAGRVTLRATGPNPAAELGENASIAAYDGTIVVDFEGRVRRMDVEVLIDRPRGVTIGLEATFELSAVGETTVQRPDWVEEGLSELAGGNRRR